MKIYQNNSHVLEKDDRPLVCEHGDGYVSLFLNPMCPCAGGFAIRLLKGVPAHIDAACELARKMGLEVRKPREGAKLVWMKDCGHAKPHIIPPDDEETTEMCLADECARQAMNDGDGALNSPL